jgi:hypothetical protein
VGEAKNSSHGSMPELFKLPNIRRLISLKGNDYENYLLQRRSKDRYTLRDACASAP